jgi:hypothetical protein
LLTRKIDEIGADFICWTFRVTHFGSIFQDEKKEKTKAEILELAAKALSTHQPVRRQCFKATGSLFDKAIEPNSCEMRGARYRREPGNPPGSLAAR